MDALIAGRISVDKIKTVWRGAVTWRETPALRERLSDLLETPGGTSLRVDVRGVTSIDQSGIAVLTGANDRAAATGRTFVLIDAGGPVSQALRQMHLLNSFLVTQLVPANRDLAGMSRARHGRSQFVRGAPSGTRRESGSGR
jgi:anti-anti-sigma regulatory factor